MTWLWLLMGWLGLSLFLAAAWVGLSAFTRWRVKRRNGLLLRASWEMYRDELAAWEAEFGRPLTLDEFSAIIRYFER